MYRETWAYNYLIIPNDDNFSERFGESNFLHEFEESGYSVVRQYDRGETLRTKQFLNRCRKVVESNKLLYYAASTSTHLTLWSAMERKESWERVRFVPFGVGLGFVRKHSEERKGSLMSGALY